MEGHNVAHQGLTFKPIMNEEQLAQMNARLGKQITAYYEDLSKEKRVDLLLICVLKGAFMFFSDLVKRVSFPHEHEFIRCKSYKGTKSTGILTL